jgi:hypothetical protein
MIIEGEFAMSHVRFRFAHLLTIAIAATCLVALACSSRSSKYVGRWECSSGRTDFFEIKANSGAFLVTDESGATYPAVLDDRGTLVISGVPLIGSLPLPIDADSNELICSTCGCKRFMKKVSQQSTRAATSQSFGCEPSVLRSGQDLVLTLPSPHGRELGIVTPDKGLLFVAFRPESPTCRPPIASDDFLAQSRVELHTTSAVGVHTPCDTKSLKIFEALGTYEIVVSPNLETEDSPANLRCKIELVKPPWWQFR